MSGLDRRTAHDRDLIVLAQIAREGGFSLDWLISNRDNAASLHRLIACGSLKQNGSGWIRCESDAKPTLWERVKRFLIGEEAV